MDIMGEIYNQVLPLMEKSGIKDTPKNRHAYLIGVRAACIDQKDPEYVIKVLTNEIIRLGDEIDI